MSKVVSILIINLFLSGVGFCQGGPPMMTDDPGTPGDKIWEINTALVCSSGHKATSILFPLLDINRGIGDDAQISMTTNLSHYVENGSDLNSGLSTISLGFKKRFFENQKEKILISVDPKIDFHHFLSSKNTNINPEGNKYSLGFQFQKSFDVVGINPDFGYATSPNGSEISHGLAIGFEFEKDREFMLEGRGKSAIGSNETESLVNIGARVKLNKTNVFLGSVGKILKAYGDEQRPWIVFIGYRVIAE